MIRACRCSSNSEEMRRSGADACSATRAGAPRACWTRADQAIRKRLAEFRSPVAKRHSQVEDCLGMPQVDALASMALRWRAPRRVSACSSGGSPGDMRGLVCSPAGDGNRLRPSAPNSTAALLLRQISCTDSARSWPLACVGGAGSQVQPEHAFEALRVRGHGRLPLRGLRRLRVARLLQALTGRRTIWVGSMQ